MREALIMAFLGGLVTFSAFGATILAFLTGGNALGNVADFWVQRRKGRVDPDGKESAGGRRNAEGSLAAP